MPLRTLRLERILRDKDWVYALFHGLLKSKASLGKMKGMLGVTFRYKASKYWKRDGMHLSPLAR